MIVLPAIDLYDGCAVRLLRGDYNQKTVYSNTPVAVAQGFHDAGAAWLHVVDLQGARDGTTANLPTVQQLVERSGLLVEIGGGIRSPETVRTYLDMGVRRVILGTAALENPAFVADMVARYGDRIAVGVDMRGGKVAVKGWLETADKDGVAFCRELEAIGVSTVICTDISKDGAMAGPNVELYRRLSDECALNIVASGGVSSLGDIQTLTSLSLYGAILGKALYTGAVDLKAALALSGGDAPC